MRPLLRIAARNFRSLRDIDVELGPLNVLVGPNEAGKSNFLDLIAFLGDSARVDLAAALDMRGGLERVLFRGEEGSSFFSVHVSANVTTHSSETAPDEYDLKVLTASRGRSTNTDILLRTEEFRFKRTQGRGRRITVSGNKVEFVDTRGTRKSEKELPLRSDSLALSTLRRLPSDEGGEEVDKFAQLFTTFKVFNPDVEKARRPGRGADEPIESDASNLASALIALMPHEQGFADLVEDARAMIPGFEGLEFEQVGGAEPALAVKLVERGLRDSTYLADASFGTVRLLALLALLYDPNPPLLTCIEEIDHGLHPYLFDRLVERLREASHRTQLLIATHSPALVNRLAPDELIVAERAPDGSTRMPAISTETIAAKQAAVKGHLELGELWFSGALGGVPR